MHGDGCQLNCGLLSYRVCLLSEEQSSGKYFSFFGWQGPLAIHHIQHSILWIVHSVSLENPQVIVL